VMDDLTAIPRGRRHPCVETGAQIGVGGADLQDAISRAPSTPCETPAVRLALEFDRDGSTSNRSPQKSHTSTGFWSAWC